MAVDKLYDIALSFAGEDRDYVAEVAKSLRRRKIRIFCDDFESVDLWGKNLYDHLSDIYANQDEFVVMFISKHYVQKRWTKLECQRAQSRAHLKDREYILPVRFEDTDVPGLKPATAHLDLNKLAPTEVAEFIMKKITLFREQGLKYLVAVRGRIWGRPLDYWFTKKRYDDTQIICHEKPA